MLIRDFSRETFQKSSNAGTMLRAVASESRLAPMIQPPSSQFVRVGGYKFKEQDLLGKGFSSRVYRAAQVNGKSDKFAIKVINLKKFKSSNIVMLENEIEVHRNLEHPNIVKFYDAYKTDEFYYIVMEYCPHGDLLEFMNQKKKMDENIAEKIIHQVLDAYKYLARKGVLHRDLKPANIFRSGDTWKIGDFGFSIYCHEQHMFDRVNVGTPLYMPLQSLKNNKYSAKSDIFAIGIMFYEMLTGSTPWPCKTQKELVLKMKTVPFKAPEHVKKDWISSFLNKACQVDENQRLSRSQLENICTSQSQPSNPEDKEENSPPVLAKKVSLKNFHQPSSQITGKPPINKETSPANQNSTSASQSSSKGKEHETFRPSNTRSLLHELQYCRLIYYMIKNIDSFPFAQASERDFVRLTLFKFLLRCVKQLEDPEQYYGKLVWEWSKYKTQKQYKNIQVEIINYSKRYEKEYLNVLKNADIGVIRAVNRKFPELSYTSGFDVKFYGIFTQYFVEVLRLCNHEVMKLEAQGNERPAVYQSIETLYHYYKVLCEKHKFAKCDSLPSGYSSVLSQLSSHIVLDYSTSKLSAEGYQQLRGKIKEL